MPSSPSQTAQANIVDVYGEMGRLWLEELPETLSRVCEQWNLRIEALLGGNYAAVYLVRDADSDLRVLKVGVPAREIEREWRALRAFEGCGCVALRALDRWGTALLLDRVSPGRTAKDLSDDKAMGVAADLMALLHRAPVDHELPDVGTLGDAFGRLRRCHGGGTGPFEPEVIDAAERTLVDVLPQMPRLALHGDLHHGNILSKSDGWISIDPHGVRGPAEWEAGALLRNPWEKLRQEAKLGKRLARRVDILCEQMGWDPTVVRTLASAQAVLSSVWSWEDHGAPDPYSLQVAAALTK